MKAFLYPAFGEVDLSGTAGEYHALAALVAAGSGTQAAEPDATDAFGGTVLTRIQVSTSANSLVLISAGADGILQISGAPDPLAILASNFEAMATAEKAATYTSTTSQITHTWIQDQRV
ncbi:hypothetical protein AB0C04_29390 [Micromonospora sp. NPDC048909]|uniref:hypothetical protein n=1 Tax=Micromonospora sp. NPDC048909 TaxID=3155643 RepID=UPI0033DBDA51